MKKTEQTSAALLIVGDTGSGKTSLLGTLALYVWQKYQKITRLATFDPGGYGDDVQVLVDAGIVQVFRGYTRDPEGQLGLALETCSLVTRGYWPRSFIDVSKGVVAPGVDMVAPQTQIFLMYCPKGHPAVKAKTQQGLRPIACPTCKTQTSVENAEKVEHSVEITPGFEKIGAMEFDGLTSMSEWGMTDMGVRAAKNELGGEKSALNTLLSGGIKYGAGNRAAVGFMQNRAHEWVMNALAIPNLSVPPAFTALELRATDDRSDLPIYGPKIAGNAKTAEVPQWFGNTLGTVIWPGDKGPEWRLYLREYRTPGDNAPHLCKVRTTPNVMPEFLVDSKDEEPFTSFSLGKFYELAEGSFAKAQERLQAKLAGAAAPGLGSGEVGGKTPPLAPRGKQTSLPAGSAEGGTGAPPTAAPASSPAPATPSPASPAAPPAQAASGGGGHPPVPPPAAKPAAGAPSSSSRAPGVPPPAGQAKPAAPSPAAVAPRAPTPSPVAPPPPVGASAAAGAGSRPSSVPPPAGARPAPRPPATGPVAVGKAK
jgi:energy-coupling factor transporter ATP-binding protein EcfA2